MLGKIATIVFYFGIALWAFGIGFPFLMILIGVAAIILGILALM